jgi:hypothetical protein
MEVIKNKQKSRLKNGNLGDILILLAATNLILDINSLDANEGRPN